MDITYQTPDGEYSMDGDALTEFIGGVMNAPEGTLAHQVRNDWAEVAVSINADKLYESVE